MVSLHRELRVLHGAHQSTHLPQEDPELGCPSSKQPQVGLQELGGVFQPKRSWDSVKRSSDGLWNVFPKQPEWTCLRGSCGSCGSRGAGRWISKLFQFSLKLWDLATDLDVSGSSSGRQSTAVGSADLFERSDGQL